MVIILKQAWGSQGLTSDQASNCFCITPPALEYAGSVGALHAFTAQGAHVSVASFQNVGIHLSLKGACHMPGKFEVYTDKAGEFRFRLKASNGQAILASEGYKTKASCLNGVESIQKNAPNDARYESKESKSGKFMFNLKATNGQVIGTSELYESAASRDNGIESVKKNAPEATVVEVTA
ncbi:YegP family protein [Azonexus fungiphilus]|uniref:YegP family protein n=1 Tax=Azonexus fungiphilus TaxID=146940 RepID=UPI001C2C1370|nr:YegP family protein [Azonexus fungiphilus]